MTFHRELAAVNEIMAVERDYWINGTDQKAQLANAIGDRYGGQASILIGRPSLQSSPRLMSSSMPKRPIRVRSSEPGAY